MGREGRVRSSKPRGRLGSDEPSSPSAENLSGDNLEIQSDGLLNGTKHSAGGKNDEVTSLLEFCFLCLSFFLWCHVSVRVYVL